MNKFIIINFFGQFVARSQRMIGDQYFQTDSPRFLRREDAETRGNSMKIVSDAQFRYESRMYPAKYFPGK